MPNKKRLTEEEFEYLRPFLSRVKPRNVEAAKKILVDGRPQAELASELSVTPKTICQLVTRVWKLHIKHGHRPKGWVEVSVTLPADIADIVIDMERKALARAKEQQ